jgi:hypothetical protein
VSAVPVHLVVAVLALVAVPIIIGHHALPVPFAAAPRARVRAIAEPVRVCTILSKLLLLLSPERVWSLLVRNRASRAYDSR